MADEKVNLADPSFEPTDAQLIELSVRAFAGVRAANDRALQKLHSDILAAKQRVLDALRDGAAVGRDAR
jgi:hypothetical protein